MEARVICTVCGQEAEDLQKAIEHVENEHRAE